MNKQQPISIKTKATVFGSIALILCGLSFFLGMVYSKSMSTQMSDVIEVRVTRMLSAKEAYEMTGSLESLVAYGNSLDSANIIITQVRDSLEDQFFYKLAIEAGNRYNVSWRLLYGIWKWESRMDPSAKGDGKKNAKGDVIPGTWRAFGLGQIHLASAKEHYDSSVTVERLMNPIENGFASAAILRDYMKIFNGDEHYGVSAYNAGPTTTMPFYKKKIQPVNYWNYTRHIFKYGIRADDKS